MSAVIQLAVAKNKNRTEPQTVWPTTGNKHIEAFFASIKAILHWRNLPDIQVQRRNATDASLSPGLSTANVMSQFPRKHQAFEFEIQNADLFTVL